ncbi:hypothetical protein [Paenibacillus sp.]
MSGTILKFGVGTENLTEKLIAEGHKVYGIEPSQGMIHQVQKRNFEFRIDGKIVFAATVFQDQESRRQIEDEAVSQGYTELLTDLRTEYYTTIDVLHAIAVHSVIACLRFLRFLRALQNLEYDASDSSVLAPCSAPPTVSQRTTPNPARSEAFHWKGESTLLRCLKRLIASGTFSHIQDAVRLLLRTCSGALLLFSSLEYTLCATRSSIDLTLIRFKKRSCLTEVRFCTGMTFWMFGMLPVVLQ